MLFLIFKYYKKYILAILFYLASFLASVEFAAAREIIQIKETDKALDISRAIQYYQTNHEHIKVQTAPLPNGSIRSEEVQATQIVPPNKRYNWGVFSVVNNTQKEITRLIVLPRYRVVGSGLRYPDLGKVHIISITPSIGSVLKKLTSYDSDIFIFSIKPNTNLTFVAELTDSHLPPIYLWEPDSYKDTQNSFTLFQGVLLGIAVFISIVLTVLVIVQAGNILLPIMLLGWSIVLSLAIDFHFINKLLNISIYTEHLLRALSELLIAVFLINFITSYLKIFKIKSHILLFQIALTAVTIGACGLSLFYPAIVASLARFLLLVGSFGGAAIIIYMAAKHSSRAILIIPAWLVFVLWTMTFYACILSRIDNDIIEPALKAGLILILLLITVTILHEFFATDNYSSEFSSRNKGFLDAVLNCGLILWDWDIKHNRLKLTSRGESFFKNNDKKFSGEIKNFTSSLHIDDRTIFSNNIESLLHRKKSTFEQHLRISTSENYYHWYTLRITTLNHQDGEPIRCLGTLTNIDEFQEAKEQMLKDTIFDNLTDLPNRSIFLDRLQTLASLSDYYKTIPFVVMIIDFDGFRSINEKYGQAIGNRFLRITAKRLIRNLEPQDTLTHLKADRFAAIIVGRDKSTTAQIIDSIQKAATSPMHLDEIEIKLTCSIGLYNNHRHSSYTAKEILQNAELAIASVKRENGNGIKLFTPDMASMSFNLHSLSQDLPNAIERGQIQIVYHPILAFDDSKLVGFEGYTIWNHPKFGKLSILDFMSCAENTAYIRAIGCYTFKTIAKDLVRIQDELANEDFFISMNINTADMLHQDFLDEISATQLRFAFEPSRFILEMSESVLSEKPEQSSAILQKISDAGFGLSLDNFSGAGSSLTYLANYDFNMVKFDKIILHNPNDKKSKLLRSIIAFAHSLNKKTIATAVDNETQAKWLSSLGCDYIQSTIFTEALDIAQLIEWIKKSKEKL